MKKIAPVLLPALILLCVSTFSCKKKKREDPTPAPVVTTTPSKAETGTETENDSIIKYIPGEVKGTGMFQDGPLKKITGITGSVSDNSFVITLTDSTFPSVLLTFSFDSTTSGFSGAAGGIAYAINETYGGPATLKLLSSSGNRLQASFSFLGINPVNQMQSPKLVSGTFDLSY